MNNNKHTQGNWSVSKTINDFAIYSDKDTSNDIAAVYQYSRNISKEEAEANAKLIAAAPELLEALQRMLRYNKEWFTPLGKDYLVYPMDITQAIFNATQAINKATL